MPRFRPIENRYNPADWEIDPDCWLWRPSTKLALLGDGYGTMKARSSGPGSVTGTLVNGGRLVRDAKLHSIVYKQTANDQYMTLSSPKTAYGFACWYYMTAIDNYSMLCGNNTTSYDLLALRQTTIHLRSPGVTEWSFSPTANRWTHFALAVRGTETSVYIDGSVIGSPANTGPITDVNLIGTYYSLTLGVVGSMANVCIFSTPPTLPQIRQLASIRPDMDGLIRSKRRIIYPVASTPTARTTITRLSILGLPSRRYGGFIAKEQQIILPSGRRFTPLQLWYHII